MDNEYLRSLQKPSQIAAMLDLFVADKRCIPTDANPVSSPEQLPPGLQRIAERAMDNEGWRAWADGNGRIWFLRGKVSDTFSRRMHRPAMHVFFHDSEGELTEAGVWVRDNDGWDACAIPDARPGRRRRSSNSLEKSPTAIFRTSASVRPQKARLLRPA
jgi:hypothetical protein